MTEDDCALSGCTLCGCKCCCVVLDAFTAGNSGFSSPGVNLAR
jgi:hypothetical protein